MTAEIDRSKVSSYFKLSDVTNYEQIIQTYQVTHLNDGQQNYNLHYTKIMSRLFIRINDRNHRIPDPYRVRLAIANESSPTITDLLHHVGGTDTSFIEHLLFTIHAT